MLENAFPLLLLACTFGFFMAWGIGANDVANTMGTAVGSRAITIKQAIIIAAIFETAGAVLASGEVTDTIRGKILNPELFLDTPEILVYGMLASLLAAGTWLLIASYKGWPVSTTHSIIGAVIGFGVIAIGSHAINWGIMTGIVLSWVVTPFIAGIISYFLFISIVKLILRKKNPLDQAKIYIPFYLFLVAFIVTFCTLVKGLKHLGLGLTLFESTYISVAISLLFTLLGIWLMQRIKLTQLNNRRASYENVERLFTVLMMFTACAMAFAHGSNDIANAIGPLAAAIQIINEGSTIATTVVPLWVFLLGATGILLGLAMYGYKVITTIGNQITALTPSHGFSAQLAAATTVVIASIAGLPISTTQTLVGAVLGVGLARGIAALNLRVIRNIFMSWIITLPAGAFLAILFYLFIRMLFA